MLKESSASPRNSSKTPLSLAASRITDISFSREIIPFKVFPSATNACAAFSLCIISSACSTVVPGSNTGIDLRGISASDRVTGYPAVSARERNFHAPSVTTAADCPFLSLLTASLKRISSCRIITSSTKGSILDNKFMPVSLLSLLHQSPDLSLF